MLDNRRADPAPFVWNVSASEILEKGGRSLPRSNHD